MAAIRHTGAPRSRSCWRVYPNGGFAEPLGSVFPCRLLLFSSDSKRFPHAQPAPEEEEGGGGGCVGCAMEAVEEEEEEEGEGVGEEEEAAGARPLRSRRVKSCV